MEYPVVFQGRTVPGNRNTIGTSSGNRYLTMNAKFCMTKENRDIVDELVLLMKQEDTDPSDFRRMFPSWISSQEIMWL